ncbi:MAG: polysaccharide deacetylase family protein [Nitrospira sp. BO4]|nr:polysaccharide deacetylase family protein [Nitrospira sp. BO4]
MSYGPPVISIDVEDWPQSTWDHSLPITDRAAENTRRVLRLLRETEVRSTMFVLGKLAERFPEVVKEIEADGHEVACHGHGHLEIGSQSPDEFLADIRRSKDLLEQIIGKPVKGYRAPDFSIVQDTLWALDALAEAGFEYDSSIVPAQMPRYGIAGWPVLPVRVRLGQSASILEAPLATFRALGRNLPVGGGGYHRLLPGFASRYCARKIMTVAPFVFYCHPYEFDVHEFREIPVRVPRKVQFHQGAGRRWFEPRFRSFVKCFGGQAMCDMLSLQQWSDFHLHSLKLDPPEQVRVQLRVQ